MLPQQVFPTRLCGRLERQRELFSAVSTQTSRQPQPVTAGEGEGQQNHANEMPGRTGLESRQRCVSDSPKNTMPVWTGFCFPIHVLKTLGNEERGLFHSVWTVPGMALNVNSPSKGLLCANEGNVPTPEPHTPRPHTLTLQEKSSLV